jgi:hypothetical protein
MLVNTSRLKTPCCVIAAGSSVMCAMLLHLSALHRLAAAAFTAGQQSALLQPPGSTPMTQARTGLLNGPPPRATPVPGGVGSAPPAATGGSALLAPGTAILPQQQVCHTLCLCQAFSHNDSMASSTHTRESDQSQLTFSHAFDTVCGCRVSFLFTMSLWVPCGLLSFLAEPITVTATVYCEGW